ncbi:hypothetical protein CH063_15786 [Colletotrichum higginsianum]|uniref:Uncharacterized protein n=1 Tax=Colletotrichum higginsianum (strain IMI 349063) TaxID=759273 RepID=H1W4F8_COLHI|nr:hypothetical protein CH063_15786 [Colletotrichum higginsianum]
MVAALASEPALTGAAGKRLAEGDEPVPVPLAVQGGEETVFAARDQCDDVQLFG